MEQLPTGYFSNTLKVSENSSGKKCTRRVTSLLQTIENCNFSLLLCKKAEEQYVQKKVNGFHMQGKAKVNFYGDDKSFEGMFQTFVLQSFSNTSSCLLFPSFAGMFAAANLSNFRTNVQQQ